LENGLKPFRSAIASILSIASLLAADAALAQAGCYSLQAELMRLQEEAGSGGSARYETAFREQERVLAATEAEARQAGCFGGGFLFFRSQPSRACPRLVPKIRDMRANLTKLDRLRRSSGGAHPSLRRLGEIKAIMANRGCAAPGVSDTTLEAPWTQQRGTFRTLCVRTCDGFFFPISFATTRGQFGTDEARCQALCPGTEAKLFAHSNPGEGPEQMTGMDGRPYADMPTAFRYRTSFDASCTCKSGSPTIATNVPGGGAHVDITETVPPVPDPRPAPGEDPETIANRMGGFSFGRTQVAVAQAPSARPDGKQVRVVGPAYWDAPEQEGVVIAPVPN
jgi:hypothetical protein